MKYLLLIFIFFTILACEYESHSVKGESIQTYKKYLNGKSLSNELGWTLWELIETINVNYPEYPRYTDFYLSFNDYYCEHFYKEENNEYFSSIRGEYDIIVDEEHDINFINLQKYFLGMKTFNIIDDIFTLKIDKGRGPAVFIFQKTDFATIEVRY